MYIRSAHALAPRRGVILLVVIALLTLFASVGIAFVLYAQSRADIARIFRDSEQRLLNQGPTESGQLLLSEFLRQFIFDVWDAAPQSGTPPQSSGAPPRNSVLRGHSLARTMFGSNGLNPGPLSNNTIAFNGIGRLRNAALGTSVNPWAASTNPAVDDYDLVNYLWFQSDQQTHDPERVGWRSTSNPPGAYQGGFNVPYTYPDVNNMFLAAVKADGTVLCPSFHRPWLTRKYLSEDFTLNTNDTKWTDTSKAWLKYMTLRLRPAEMGTGFPLPVNGGDVKNLNGGPGGNDSIWLDLGFDVQQLPDGRKYKPLFAPLIIDLDGRVNLNNHGNMLGLLTGSSTPNHASNQGWGAWEVNLKWVLNCPPLSNNAITYNGASPLSVSNLQVAVEWKNLFLGNSSDLGLVYGRYGPDGRPTNTTAQPGVAGVNNNSPNPSDASPFGYIGTGYQNTSNTYQVPPFYSKIDYNACDEKNASIPSSVISPPQGTALSVFPTYNSGYGNGQQDTSNPTQDEVINHPLLYNFFQPGGHDPTNLATVFTTNYDNSPSGYNTSVGQLPMPSIDDSDMLAMLYDLSDATSLKTASTSGILCPLNFSDYTTSLAISQQNGTTAYLYLGNSSMGVRRRMLVTPRSFDLDVAGFTPWIWDRDTVPMAPTPTIQPYTFTSTALYPTGQPIGYPGSGATPPTNTVPNDFSSDGRGNTNIAALLTGFTSTQGRLDLNRPLLATRPTAPFLTPYPAPSTTAPNVGIIANADMATFNQAQADRQQFAADLFARLQKLTGAADLTGANAPAVGTPQYNALRWLAQLAVNIVDYIDSDDIMTPFNWDTTNNGWVYGTELPRLVLNEVYAEVVNNPLDLGGSLINATKPYNVNFSIELYNPLNNSDANLYPSSNITGDPPGAVRLVQNPQDPTSTAIYQIMVAKTAPNIRAVDNVLGDPDFNLDPTQKPNTMITVGGAGNANYSGTPAPAQVTTGTMVLPSNGAFNGPVKQNTGFLVLGPTTSNTDLSVVANMAPLPATLNLSALTYTIPNTTDLSTLTKPVVLLRRLACPWLPFNATTNPYVTVDYMDNIPLTTNIGVQLFGAGAPAFTGTIATPVNRHSYGRVQPYANPSSGSFAIVQQTPTTASATGPQTTLFQHNAKETSLPITPAGNTLNLPFFWLTHLDRQLVSPMELLEVSAFKPHELTHQIVDTTGVPYQHRAPWFDNTARIYRIFDFLETWNRQLGALPPGSRIPGKININTTWDPEPLLAVADPQPSNANSFTVPSTATPLNTQTMQAGTLFNPMFSVTNPGSANSGQPSDPATIYEQFMASRSPTIQGVGSGKDPAGNPITFYSHVPGPNDQPFMSLSFGAYPAGDSQFTNGGLGGGLTGVNATLLRPLAVSKDPVNITTPGTPVTVSLALLNVNSALVTANATMPVTLAVDSGANEEFITIAAGSIAAGKLNNATFNKSHLAGFGIGRILAPIMTAANSANQTPMTPPYLQHQLLNKIYNNVTTRSNVFAIWLTVGFFQVVDDSTNPNKLGYELGAESGTGTLRRHVFAIVDRTALCIQDPNGSSTTAVAPNDKVPSGGLFSINTAAALSAQPGSLIILEPGTSNQETVMVLAASPSQTANKSQLVFRCNKSHQSGFTMVTTIPGNPGPQSSFDMNSNRPLVPYYTTLD